MSLPKNTLVPMIHTLIKVQSYILLLLHQIYIDTTSFGTFNNFFCHRPENSTMSKPTNNTFMNNESESDSDLVLVSTFPTFAQLEKNSYLKQIWEEWNSYDHQDIPLYNEIQLILQEMNKEEMKNFPTAAQLEENNYLKQIWEEWNSNDHQDISLYNEIQFILQEMKKSSTSKPAK